MFPGTRIPEWFDQQKSGHSISFWFRNKLPAKLLCLLIALSTENFILSPDVFINGKFEELEPYKTDEIESMSKLDHTYIFYLQKLPFKNGNLFEEVAREKEWNHVEVRYDSVLELESSLIKGSGIHIFREEGSMEEDIGFDDPYLSSSASESPSFLQTIALGTRKFSIAFFLFFILLFWFPLSKIHLTQLLFTLSSSCTFDAFIYIHLLRLYELSMYNLSSFIFLYIFISKLHKPTHIKIVFSFNK